MLLERNRHLSPTMRSISSSVRLKRYRFSLILMYWATSSEAGMSSKGSPIFSTAELVLGQVIR